MTNPILHGTRIPPDQQAIRDRCYHPSGTFVEFRKEVIEQSVTACFEAQVRRYPERIAVQAGRQELRYEALNKAANRLAHAILGQRGEESEPICLLLEQGVSLITAHLGALKAGKIVVPLDPSHPQPWLDHLLGDTQPGLLIANDRNVLLAKGLAGENTQVLNLEALNDGLSTENPGLSIPAANPAYIIYTSGTTGQPKGVVQSHQTVLHWVMHCNNALHVCQEDRLTLFFSPSFVSTVRNIFSALLSGAALFPYAIGRDDIDNLVPWIIREKITFFYSVPTLFRRFAHTLVGDEKIPNIRLVYLTGEPARLGDLELICKHFDSRCILINGIGATEVPNFGRYFFDQGSTIADSILPVGYATDDTKILILDDEGQEVGFGQTGEIVVKSRYLSGYWQKPDDVEINSEGVENGVYHTGDLGRLSADGCLFHLGRMDFQVKIRGHRVGVSEIETALLSIDGVTEAVVVAREDQSGNSRLLAYLVSTPQPTTKISQLRNTLKEMLPDYMVPSLFVFLEELPLLSTGKVDRLSLPTPKRTRPELDNPNVAPSSPVEEKLAKIWGEVLGLDQIGIQDNFLELGGDSLLASQVIARAIKAFHVEVPLRSLWESPTVAEMAMIIVQGQIQEAHPADIERMLQELGSLPKASSGY